MAISQPLVFTRRPLDLIVSLCGKLAFPSWLFHSVIRARLSTGHNAGKCDRNVHQTPLTSLSGSTPVGGIANDVSRKLSHFVSKLLLISPGLLTIGLHNCH